MDKPRRTQMMEKLLVEARGISPRRRFMMAVAVGVACIYLFTLKHEGQQARAVIVATQAATAEQRAVLNAQIMEHLPSLLGGESHQTEQVALVARVATAITTKSDANKATKPLKFHLMAEPNSINAYGLADGNIYITTAMLNRMQTEGQLAAVLSHAAAHALIGDSLTALAAGVPSQNVWQHSVEQERLADGATVKLMAQAGYDPNAFASMLGVLTKAYNAKADVAFFTTHPNAAERLQGIAAAIAALYPQGVPEVLSK